jgi:transcription antitermination factor NusG
MHLNIVGMVPRNVLWKTSHPSEDGEALQKMAHQSLQFVSEAAAEDDASSRQNTQWYAVYTAPRHEKAVARHFLQREIQHYLPLYRAERHWSDGSRVVVELPLFPGYIFVCIPRCARACVLSVPGTLSIIAGTGGEPAVLPDAVIETLRGGLLVRLAEPHPLLTVGERVRIRSGALMGMEGVIVRSKKGARVVLTIESIMRSIAVEVPGEDLEPVLSAGSPVAWQSMLASY